MPRAKRVLSMVCAMVRLCAGLWPSALVENDFMVNVARDHGRSMSVQCFPMRPRSLPLHWTVFHPLRCHFTWLWPRASAARTVRVEVDRRWNNRWCIGPLLYS
jgi:hypothetical protein